MNFKPRHVFIVWVPQFNCEIFGCVHHFLSRDYLRFTFGAFESPRGEKKAVHGALSDASVNIYNKIVIVEYIILDRKGFKISDTDIEWHVTLGMLEKYIKCLDFIALHIISSTLPLKCIEKIVVYYFADII